MKLLALACVLLGAALGIVPAVREYRKKRRRDAAKSEAARTGSTIDKELAGAYGEVADQASAGNMLLIVIGGLLVIVGALMQFLIA